MKDKVYSWGDGTYGELGLGEKVLMITKPTEIKYFSENNIKVTKVEAGSRHSLVLASDGTVYGFGFNGSSDTMEMCVQVPTKNTEVKCKVIDLFAGEKHSVCVGADGGCY